MGRMGEKFLHAAKDPKIMGIFTLALLLALIFFVGFSKKEATFQLEDKCGRFVNLFSHTIPDEDACMSRCRNQCASADYNFRRIEFRAAGNGCNNCTCYCK